MAKRYRGGVWLDLNHSGILEKPLDELPAPARVVLPLRQHPGEPAALCVKPGRNVLLGQPVGTGEKPGSCTVHSPVSGVVEEIATIHDSFFGACEAVVIENDGRDKPYEYAPPARESSRMSPDELLACIRRAGIAGDNGPREPLAERLARYSACRIETLVLNAVETEPYLCTAQKLLSESPDGVAAGLSALLRAAGARECILAVADAGADVFDDMLKAAEMLSLPVRLRRVRPKYPSAHETFLYKLLTGRALPEGRAPEEFGVGFVYAGECLAVHDAVSRGLAQTTRIITVAGPAVEHPQVVRARIGTSLQAVLDHCGISLEPERVILGGAMRGTAVSSLLDPFTKPVTAILALPPTHARTPARCIYCGKCVQVCPKRLFPNFIAMNAAIGDFAACRGFDIDECIECGSCAYICPGRVPIVELIKTMKKESARASATRLARGEGGAAA